MTLREEVKPGQLAELLKQVEAGHEVVLTQDQKPVAMLVPAEATKAEVSRGPLKIRSFKGHRVLTPTITNAEIAEDLYGQR